MHNKPKLTKPDLHCRLLLTPGNALMILAAASAMNPNYAPTTWQTFLLTLSLMIVQSVISSFPTLSLARFNSVSTFFNVSDGTTD